MKCNISFVASDGQEFDSAKGCIVYESTVNNARINHDCYLSGMIMYHHIGGKILNNGLGSISEETLKFLLEASAVVIFDKCKAEEFLKIIHHSGMTIPDVEPGLYIRNNMTGQWESFDAHVQSMRDVADKYLKM